MTDGIEPAEADQGADGRLWAPPERIADKRFIEELKQLRKLKNFLFEEKAIKFDEINNPSQQQLGAIDLKELNNIYVYSKSGRSPFQSEWRLLDEKMLTLASYLSGDDLKRKFRIRELGRFFRIYPIIFLSFSVAASVLDVVIYQQLHRSGTLYYLLLFICNLFWSGSQGGLGACAFLGTSAILRTSVDADDPHDPTKSRERVDVTDRNFLQIRMLLGALFGFILGGPFAQQAFSIGNRMFFDQASPTLQSIAIIFIPFLSGFSTNLVLVVLSRFVVAIETFFGLPGRS